MGRQIYRIEAKKGRPIVIRKAAVYHSSRGVPVPELFDRCRRSLDRVRDKGFEFYWKLQRAWLDDFWRGADVVKFWPLVALTVAIAVFEGSSLLQRLSFLTTFKEAALLQSAPLPVPYRVNAAMAATVR